MELVLHIDGDIANGIRDTSGISYNVIEVANIGECLIDVIHYAESEEEFRKHYETVCNLNDKLRNIVFRDSRIDE